MEEPRPQGTPPTPGTPCMHPALNLTSPFLFFNFKTGGKKILKSLEKHRQYFILEFSFLFVSPVNGFSHFRILSLSKQYP